MQIVILGAAAGGGAPQWNCNCSVCRELWNGADGCERRSQSSLAVSVDGERWVLFNCSPDLRQQILSTPALHPRPQGSRHSPIFAVVLTNADIDHIAGLLSLREGQAFRLYGSPRVLDVLAANPIFDALDPELVPRLPVALGQAAEVAPGLELEMFAVPGKVALYLERAVLEAGELRTDQETDDTVGLRARDTASGAEFYYVPGCARMTETLARRLGGAPLVFFDGTVWTDDEMIRAGVGTKTGARMGHMAMAGAGGSLNVLSRLAIGRGVFIHINNTNPVLRRDSEERAQVAAAGFELAYDGMEIRL